MSSFVLFSILRNLFYLIENLNFLKSSRMVFYVVSVSIYAILSLFIETIDLCMGSYHFTWGAAQGILFTVTYIVIDTF